MLWWVLYSLTEGHLSTCRGGNRQSWEGINLRINLKEAHILFLLMTSPEHSDFCTLFSDFSETYSYFIQNILWFSL